MTGPFTYPLTMSTKLQKRSPVRAATSSTTVPLAKFSNRSASLQRQFKASLSKAVRRKPARCAFSVESVPTVSGRTISHPFPVSGMSPRSTTSTSELKLVDNGIGVATRDDGDDQVGEYTCTRPDAGDCLSPLRPQVEPSQPSDAPSDTVEHHLRSRSFSRLGRVKEDDSPMLPVYDNLDGVMKQAAEHDIVSTGYGIHGSGEDGESVYYNYRPDLYTNPCPRLSDSQGLDPRSPSYYREPRSRFIEDFSDLEVPEEMVARCEVPRFARLITSWMEQTVLL